MRRITPGRIYNFKRALAVGQRMEAFIDQQLMHWYEKIVAAKSIAIQRMGIDRFAQDKVGNWFALEYKADFKAAKTEKFFLELEIVPDQGNVKPGWVKKLNSLVLVICVPTMGRTFFFESLRVKHAVNFWCQQQTFRQFGVQNNGYSGLGIAVPIQVLQEAAAYYFDGVNNVIEFDPATAPQISVDQYSEQVAG